MKDKILRFIYVAACVLFASPVGAQDESPNPRMYISLTDGEMLTFELSEKPIVSFDEDNLKIFSADFSAEIEAKVYGAVKKVFFSKDTATDNTYIKPEIRQSFKFVDGCTVYISGSDILSDIGVYSADGRKIDADIIYNNNNEAVINLNSLIAGFYIIKINRQSYKIKKR